MESAIGKLIFFSIFSIQMSKFLSHAMEARVEAPEGTFLGTIHKSARQERPVYTFTGIPYAKPPLDQLRFKYPIPYGKHTEVYNATKSSPECLQWDSLLGRGIIGSEDCLYLNIYSNRIPDPPHFYNTMPVLVFLHAGTYISGGGAWDLFQPDYMIENDVLIVTVNHRLGPFGFLSTEDTQAPGNYGLMDLVRALEWIRTNIRPFGGMNESISIMGAGAGGSSAHLLSMSPKARAESVYPDEYVLFKHVISHSGSAYSPHALIREPKGKALKLALRVGCPTLSVEDMIACLIETPGDKLVGQIPTMFEWDEEPAIFGPVIDKWMGSEAVIPDEPHHLIKHRQFLQIPWIAGTNKDDGAFRVQDILKDPSLVNQLNSDWDKYGPILLNLKGACKDPVAVARDIRTYYMGRKKFSEEHAKEFISMMTDRFYAYPMERAMKDHCYYLKGQKTFCYRYELVYCGRKSFLDILHKESPQEVANSLFGAKSNPRFQNTRDVHGYGVSFLDELLYLFPSSKIGLLYSAQMNADDATRVSTHMIMLWTNFMKGGEPTPALEGWPDDVSPWDAWWEPYYKGYYFYLKIDGEMETQDKPFREAEMKFWSDLPLFENRDQNVIRDEL